MTDYDATICPLIDMIHICSRSGVNVSACIDMIFKGLYLEKSETDMILDYLHKIPNCSFISESFHDYLNKVIMTLEL